MSGLWPAGQPGGEGCETNYPWRSTSRLPSHGATLERRPRMPRARGRVRPPGSGQPVLWPSGPRTCSAGTARCGRPRPLPMRSTRRTGAPRPKAAKRVASAA